MHPADDLHAEDRERLGRELMRHQRRNVRGARVREHRHHRHQHQDRPEEGVEEELERRVNPVRPAPDADDQEHRDQSSLKEQVEQHEVQRHEDAQHQRFQQQEGDHVFLDPRVDVPAGRDGQRHHEGRQHHEKDRNPVDAHLVLEAHQPLALFDELETGVGGVEVEQDEQRDEERQRRGDQRHPLGIALAGLVLTAQENGEDQRSNRRQESDDREKVAHYSAPPVIVIHVTRSAMPITMANA